MSGKKKFTVIYLPSHKEDKEWIDIEAVSEDQLVKDFKLGVILDIRESN